MTLPSTRKISRFDLQFVRSQTSILNSYFISYRRASEYIPVMVGAIVSYPMPSGMFNQGLVC